MQRISRHIYSNTHTNTRPAFLALPLYFYPHQPHIRNTFQNTFSSTTPSATKKHAPFASPPTAC